MTRAFASRVARVARPALVAAAVAGAVVAGPARAGLFDDDEARRAILEIRQKLDEQTRARQADQSRNAEQIDQLKRSLFELNTQLDQQRGDNARLRGQMEELSRSVAELQRKQTDIAQGVDERIRKIEPQKVSEGGREFTVDPDEKRSYDESLAAFRSGDFDRSGAGFAGLLKRWPSSGYRESALFWLGNAQYGARQYKEAIVSFRNLVSTAPDSPRAPEALLAIANCQAELKDTKSARRTLDELVKTYPKSEAAQAGRERIASLR